MRAVAALKLRRIHDPHHHRLALVLALLVLLFGSSCFTCQALQQQLDKQEVTTLKQIASKLRMMKWNFSVDPCSGNSGWVDKNNSSKYVVSNLTCDHCNNSTNVCHVTSIQLKGQNLTGVLPDEFANLTFLTVLDLTRNYLNGSIPVAWSSLPLIHLSILGNRISGSIPKELGRITTLQNLTLEANQLQGRIPAALGNLTNLKRFFASSNAFTGVLPEELGNLKNIMEFSIDGNPISGNIPSFIGNWTNLHTLDIEGTSLTGPFPPNFSTLESITELRASGLKGDGKFPPLQNMAGMKTLVLRNMSISGEIPEYVGYMTNLKTLDLSFNNLTGSIPSSFDGLYSSINFMFLTNNMLNGTIPNWMLSIQENIDLSYNEFTGNPAPSNCLEGFANLVSSYSSTASNSIATCLQRNFPCSGKAKNYKFFINCGGQNAPIDGELYEDDSEPLGPSRYQLSNSGKWAYSSTGIFIGNDKQNFIATNSSLLNMSNPELYMNARLSPQSLRYYGLCLQKGNYSVTLHFAEIMFNNDETYSSVGKRLFDVSIQGQKVLQDFDITKNASGTGRVITKNFTTNVEDGTLEILFQWAGKGTNSIPQKGVYGPLISAISVTPNFTPDLFEGSKLSIGAILGIVAAACVVIVSILVLCWIFYRRRDDQNNELRGIELQTGYFSLRQIKAATKNFHPNNKIGEGGFGPVFKGELPDGVVIAVKQLSSKSRQGNREFINEIGMISALQHPNLVKLFGCCVEGRQLFLIYEYLENNSLARALFGPETQRLNLDWQTRHKICLGIARGLAYLHEESRLKIVHRDIKATNVLLDKDLNAKISDFGLAKLDEGDNTHISTRIAGTVGYMAPEYAMRGYLTDKADVYSFGVVTLEIVSGMSNTSYKPKEDSVYLLDWAYVLQERGSLLDLVDPTLGPNYSKEEAMKMLELAIICTSPSSSLRPQMSTVIKMLDGKTPVPVTPVKRSEMSEIEDMRFKAFERPSHDSQSQTVSSDGPSVDTSVSVQSSREESASYSTASKLLDLTE